MRWFGEPGQTPQAHFQRAEALRSAGDIAGAVDAYQRAIDSHHPGLRLLAWENIQGLLADHADDPAVCAAHRKGVEEGLAALERAETHLRQGDIEAARAAYDEAIARNHPEYAPAAAFRLGVMLAENGATAGAIRAYNRAVASDHPDYLAMAATNLGLLYKKQHDLDAARMAFQVAVDSGHPDCVHMADIMDILLDPAATYLPVIKPRTR